MYQFLSSKKDVEVVNINYPPTSIGIDNVGASHHWTSSSGSPAVYYAATSLGVTNA